jgi:transglutaminase-like putative cysteine protease
MAALVRRYRRDPDVRAVALGIVRSVPGHKNHSGNVRALHGWVQRNIQYVQDVRGVETVQTPPKTLEYSQGDCDDQATLLATLVESIGYRVRFAAIKTNPFAPFCHVYSEVNLGTRWIPLETTEPWPAGQGPKVIAAKMTQDI